MSANPRDTQFAGFAKLLHSEIQHKLVGMSLEDWTPTYSAQVAQEIIARRAYDLACHVASEIVSGGDAPPNLIGGVPDLTELPKESE